MRAVVSKGNDLIIYLMASRVHMAMHREITSQCLRWLVLACSVGMHPYAIRAHEAAALEPLTYEPVALAWSAAEVEQASIGNLDHIKERARQANKLGCWRYCDRLDQVFNRLLPIAKAQTGHSAALDWSLTVVRLADVDAMALPGGQLIISEHFIQTHQLSDAMLAFVIAHEMSHSILEHERQVLSLARMLLPPHIPRSVSDVYTEMEFNRKLVRAIEPMIQQGEFEADELGLLMAAKAGYAPESQVAFIEAQATVTADTSSNSVAFLMSHPGARQRFARLQERLPLARRLFSRLTP